MMRARNVTGPAARGVLLVSLLIAAALPAAVRAQDLRGPLGSAAAPTPASAPAPATSGPISESVAAVVNDEIISTYDLAQRMRLLVATSGVQPNDQNLQQFQREALLSLIDEHLQLQELRRVEKEQKNSSLHLIASDKEVDQEIAGFAKQNNMSTEQLMKALKAQQINPETLRDQFRAQISWEEYIQGRYGSQMRVGEDQIKATLANLNATAAKPQYQISEVFIDANRVGGQQAAMQGAQQLVAQMQQGAPFGAVARQFSASATAASGGEVGWVTQGEMPPEVDMALEQLRPGQLSAPIPVKDGVYIIYLRDKRAGAGQTMVSLKQAAIPLPQNASAGDLEAARVKLEGLKVALKKGCADLEEAAKRFPGVVAGDLGEAEVNDLAPQFRDAAAKLQPGEVSDPIRTQVGLHLVAVCGRRLSGAGAPDEHQIENRLYGQQLSMISRRAMRDLRTSATIETR